MGHLKNKNKRKKRKDGIQDFVDQVCEAEGWEAPEVVIPEWEEFYHLAIQLANRPPERVKGISEKSLGRIIINPKHIKITTVLHELRHYNTTKKEIGELLDFFKDKPEMVWDTLELRAEGKARKLARKYGEDWRAKVEVIQNGIYR